MDVLERQRSDEVRPAAGHDGPGGEKYSSTLSLTATIDGVVCQRHALATLFTLPVAIA